MTNINDESDSPDEQKKPEKKTIKLSSTTVNFLNRHFNDPLPQNVKDLLSDETEEDLPRESMVDRLVAKALYVMNCPEEFCFSPLAGI